MNYDEEIQRTESFQNTIDILPCSHCYGCLKQLQYELEHEYYIDSLNTTQLSIQQLDNVGKLVITPAVAAATFLLMLLCFPCPPDKATGKLGLTK